MAKYTKEQKEKALALAMEKGPAQAAREMGIPTGTIKAWRKRAGATVSATATEPDATPQPQSRQPKARDERGRFLPGTSGNPSGKRSVTREARRIAEEATPEAMQRLIQVFRSTDDPDTILAYAKEILDRGLGKPKQSVDVSAEVKDTHEYHIIEQVTGDPRLLDHARALFRGTATTDLAGRREE